MRKPLVISIASVIPGLGFWLLGQPRRAVKATASVILALLVSYAIYHMTSSSLLKELCWDIALLAWFLQGMWATNTAWLLERQKQRGSAYLPRETNLADLGGHSIGKGRLVRIQEIASQQIEPGETMLVMIEATQIVIEEKSWGRVAHPFQFVYILLTKANLLVIEVDFEGIPITVERIPREQVNSAIFKKGIVQDELSLILLDERRLGFKVAHIFREQTQLLVEEL